MNDKPLNPRIKIRPSGQPYVDLNERLQKLEAADSEDSLFAPLIAAQRRGIPRNLLNDRGDLDLEKINARAIKLTKATDRILLEKAVVEAAKVWREMRFTRGRIHRSSIRLTEAVDALLQFEQESKA